MAENGASQDDRTEEASPERRDDFRNRGQVALSKDLTSVVILAACAAYLASALPTMLRKLEIFSITTFEQAATKRIDRVNAVGFFSGVWLDALYIILPVAVVTMLAATVGTLLQTRLNWSMERLKPDFSRLNPFTGVMRIFNFQALQELAKTILKTIAVSGVAYAILKNEWIKVPGLMNQTMSSTWTYWGTITTQLFWSVAVFLFIIGLADYFVNFLSLERQMKMTKQEVKEEYKRREVDPHVKARMRRMQRDIVMHKTLANTKNATVLITNPTHFSIALRYDPAAGGAPVLLAKGIDFVALKMREIAKEEKIPIIENRPLARELYATVEEGEEIPDRFYRTVAEIIRYVYKIKGKRIPTKKNDTAKPSETQPAGASSGIEKPLASPTGRANPNAETAGSDRPLNF